MAEVETAHFLVDTHNHVSLCKDPAELEEITRHKAHVLGVTNRASEYRALMPRFGSMAGLELGLGIHPEAAGSVYERHELAIFASFARDASWIAEVGLDGELEHRVAPCFGSIPTLKKQEQMLGRILEMVGTKRRFSVHSRAAEKRVNEIFSVVDASLVILHWYHGDQSVAAQALDLGFCFSINPAMVLDPERRDFLRRLPREAILLETDAPFVPWSGHDALPTDLPAVIEQLAVIRGEDADDLRSVITDNQRARGISTV